MGSCGPTMYPGRTTRHLPGNASCASSSQAIFNPPYDSSVISSVSGNGGWRVGLASVQPGGASSG